MPVTRIHTARVQIGLISWEPGVLIRGTPPPQAITLALLLRKGGATSFQGTELDQNRIVVLQPRMEFEFSAVGKCKVLVVVVEQELLEDHFLARWGDHVLTADSRDRLVVRSSSSQSAIGRIWEAMVTDVGCQSCLLTDPHFANDLEQNVLEQVLSIAEPSPPPRPGPNRQQAARRAKEYLIAHVNDPVSIGELCNAINANERTLLLGFREVFGLSPKLCLKYLRLNRVKQDLQRAGQETTVTEIATRWGFTHLSRFAGEYGQMFGEYPHETMKKARCSPRFSTTASVSAP